LTCVGGACTVSLCNPGCTNGNLCGAGQCLCNNSSGCVGAQTCCLLTGCKDLSSDPMNCGTCGYQCAPDSQCCGGSCIPANDPQNCGACGNVCPGRPCVQDPGIGIWYCK
jgi:hypothetical protein